MMLYFLPNFLLNIPKYELNLLLILPAGVESKNTIWALVTLYIMDEYNFLSQLNDVLKITRILTAINKDVIRHKIQLKLAYKENCSF